MAKAPPITKSMNGGPQFPALSQNSQVCILATLIESVANCTTHSPSISTFSKFPDKGRRIAVHSAHKNIQIKIARLLPLKSRIAIRMSKAPISGCIVHAISGSIPWDAKKGNQPALVINPQVPCPIKQRAAVMRSVQCNCVCKVFFSPECGLKSPCKKYGQPGKSRSG